MKVYILKVLAVAILGLSFLSVNAIAEESMKEIKLKTNVANATVKNKIEIISNSLKGVEEAEFSISDKTLTVKYDSDQVNSDMLMHLLKLVGYDTEIVKEKAKLKENIGKSDEKDSKVSTR